MDSLPVRYVFPPEESMDDRGNLGKDTVQFQSQDDSTEEVGVTFYGQCWLSSS